MTTTCRRAAIAACETLTDVTSGDHPLLNTTDLQIKAGDTMDVGILWGDWLTANGARLKTSTWAAGGDSPQSPTLVSNSQVMDRKGGETAVLLNAGSATPGDRYFLDNTVVVERDEDASDLPLPDRTMIRRIAVKVFA